MLGKVVQEGDRMRIANSIATANAGELAVWGKAVLMRFCCIEKSYRKFLL
jgi:hypothetical protein